MHRCTRCEEKLDRHLYCRSMSHARTENFTTVKYEGVVDLCLSCMKMLLDQHINNIPNGEKLNFMQQNAHLTIAKK